MSRITFVKFMQEALYTPGKGYYTSGVRRIGERGDYITASRVPEFGACIARWVFSRWEAMGRPDNFTVLELGAGDGTLAEYILGRLKERYHWQPAYIAVEKTIPAEGRQKGISWNTANELISLIRANKGYQGIMGVVISNEFFDALPVHRVAWREGALKEVFVEQLPTDGFREIFGKLLSPAVGAYWKSYGVALAEGQCAEANLEALRWIEIISGMLEHGYVLTVDYGDTAEKLYTPARFEGTLMSYYKQQAVSDVYARAGKQDITAHVNFTALMRHGETHGLETVFYGTQADFLLEHGILEDGTTMLATSLEAVNQNQRIKKLLLPGGFGEKFKALVQEKVRM